LYKFTTHFQYSDFMYYLTVDDVLGHIMAVASLLTILLNTFKGSYRLRWSDLEKEYQ
jgi:hypothetical protein